MASLWPASRRRLLRVGVALGLLAAWPVGSGEARAEERAIHPVDEAMRVLDLSQHPDLVRLLVATPGGVRAPQHPDLFSALERRVQQTDFRMAPPPQPPQPGPGAPPSGAPPGPAPSPGTQPPGPPPHP